MRDVNSDTFATQYASPDGISWRLNTLVWAARSALHVPGDFVECGVWKGGSAMMMALALQHFGISDRKIYLYDTYEGMTEPTAEDTT